MDSIKTKLTPRTKKLLKLKEQRLCDFIEAAARVFA